MTFDTMHIPGMLGMPRRIYTYEAGRGWGTLNFICTLGAAVPGVGILDFRLGTSSFRFAKATRRQRSVGCLDAGMVHQFAAAGIQFRRNSGRQKPPPCGTSNTQPTLIGNTNERRRSPQILFQPDGRNGLRPKAWWA
jgi:hypothetical protein